MKTPLTLQRLFLGLNGMAIEGKQLNISVIPEYDNLGNVIGTKWNLKMNNTIDDEGEELIVKDFLAGYKIDNDDYNVHMKFYDASGRFPRQIADRLSSMQRLNRKKSKRKHDESAFFQLLTIIRDYYNYIDDDIVQVLQNMKIMRTKCNLVYPLLIEIPDSIQTNNDLLKHFYSLNILSKYIKQNKNNNKNNNSMKDSTGINSNILFSSTPWQDRMEIELESYMQSLDEEAMLEIKSNYLIRNKIRYWKKVLVLQNGKRYWLSNHIFINSIKPFKELMIDLTGIEFRERVPERLSASPTAKSEFQIKSDESKIPSLMAKSDYLAEGQAFIPKSSLTKDVSVSLKDEVSTQNNNNPLDALIGNAFGFKF